MGEVVKPTEPITLKGDPGYETYMIDETTFGVRPKWISVKQEMPPKDKKFLFSYHCGEGLGEWGQCYTVFNGNSERTHEAYILILWPSAILDGNEPFCWSEEKLIEMDVKWMLLPKPPRNDENTN